MSRTLLSSPFDAAAGNYDEDFGQSPAGRLFRYRFAEAVVKRLPPQARVLDIGCGTGEDAIWLASLGFNVTGIDASRKMLAKAEAKAANSRASVSFHHADVTQGVPTLGSFDAVVSNFGAMNCVPLQAWPDLLGTCLKTGSRAHFVLMGRRPIPELLREGPRAWRARAQRTAPIESEEIGVHYASPHVIMRTIGSRFRVSSTTTLGALVPPPGMNLWPQRHPALFAALAVLERIVGRARFLCGFSDHYLIEIERMS